MANSQRSAFYYRNINGFPDVDGIARVAKLFPDVCTYSLSKVELTKVKSSQVEKG